MSSNRPSNARPLPAPVKKPTISEGNATTSTTMFSTTSPSNNQNVVKAGPSSTGGSRSLPPAPNTSNRPISPPPSTPNSRSPSVVSRIQEPINSSSRPSSTNTSNANPTSRPSSTASTNSTSSVNNSIAPNSRTTSVSTNSSFNGGSSLMSSQSSKPNNSLNGGSSLITSQSKPNNNSPQRPLSPPSTRPLRPSVAGVISANNTTSPPTTRSANTSADSIPSFRSNTSADSIPSFNSSLSTKSTPQSTPQGTPNNNFRSISTPPTPVSNPSTPSNNNVNNLNNSVARTTSPPPERPSSPITGVICDRCGESKATMDCEQCKVPFCDKCSKSIHQKGKWASHILKQRPFEKPARSSAEMPNDQNPERSQYLREQVLKEIVQTEREYLKSLEALSKIYVAPIKAGKFPDANLGTLVILFSTIEEIFTGNTDLLRQMEEESSKPTPMIGEVFLKKLDNFALYSVFCNHQDQGQKCLQDGRKNSSSFRTFLDEQQHSNSELKGLGLMDLFVKPFQRILKYPLLLKELAKNTPQEHPDHQNILQALEKLQKETQNINTNKAGADNMQKMIQIQNAIEGLSKEWKLLQQSKRFIKEGELSKINAQGKQQARYFFLFDNVLIYTAKKLISAQQYLFKKLVLLDNMLVEDVPDTNSIKNAFQLTRKDKNKTYVLLANSEREKASWLRELELATDELKNGGSDSNSNSITSLSNSVRPIWKPDSTTDNCFKCNARFNLRRRKHHCRLCGNIFCTICSSYEDFLPADYGYDEAQRVCVDCHNKLAVSHPNLNKKGPAQVSTSTYLLPHKIDRNNPSRCYKEGYLVKKGHRRKNWNRRFFVLMDGVLSYFESEQSFRENVNNSKGSIKLNEYTVHDCVNSAGAGYKFCFYLLSKDKPFLVRAENQNDKSDWLEILSIVMRKGDPLDYEVVENQTLRR